MEKDTYISLADSYIKIQGDEEEVSQNIDDISNGKVMMVLTQNSRKLNEKKS